MDIWRCHWAVLVCGKGTHLEMLQKQHDTDRDYERTLHHEEYGMMTPKGNSQIM